MRVTCGFRNPVNPSQRVRQRQQQQQQHITTNIHSRFALATHQHQTIVTRNRHSNRHTRHHKPSCSSKPLLRPYATIHIYPSKKLIHVAFRKQHP